MAMNETVNAANNEGNHGQPAGGLPLVGMLAGVTSSATVLVIAIRGVTKFARKNNGKVLTKGALSANVLFVRSENHDGHALETSLVAGSE